VFVTAELKEWTLVVMGTDKHAASQNVSVQSSAASYAFTCAGVTSNGICIGLFLLSLLLGTTIRLS
jgi:hypothetical protein